MKRVLFVLMVCCAASMTQAALIDNFDAYELGSIAGQDPMPWVETDGTNMDIAGTVWNKYMWAVSGYLNLEGIDVSPILATDTETTVFFRTMANPTAADAAFGLDDTLSPNTWDNEFYIQWAPSSGVLQARNNSGGQAIVAAPIPGVWYNIWFVINNNANTYDIYVNTGDADAVAADLAGDNWLPRGGTAGALLAFQFQGWSTKFGIDDIYIWPGTVLTNPPRPATPPDPYEFTGALGLYSVVNPHLTEPGYVIKTDWTQVPGWSSDTTPVDSGTEDDGGSNGDGWSAFVGWADEPVWQVTSTTIEAGKTYELRLMMQNSWDANQGTIYLFSTASASDPNRVILAETTQTGLTADWVPVSTSFSISAGDPNIGKYIGIIIDSTDPPEDGYGFVGFDEVQLVDPAAYALIHGAIDHSPAMGAEVAPGSINLSWTPCNDPNIVSQTLLYYIGDLIDYPDVASYNSSAISVTLSDTDNTYNIGTLGYDQAVLWRVDAVIDANSFTGETVGFTTQPTDEVPGVDAGSSYITWLANLPQSLVGDVNDFGEGDVLDADVIWSVQGPFPWTPSNTAMQMYNRAGDADLATLATNGYDSALLEDWIGTDARGSLATSSEPMVLTLSGVPAGTYSWNSYHHDAADQTGSFSVTVVDAAGSSTTTGIDVSAGAELPVTEFSTTITSDGSDIKLMFDNTGTDNSTQFFVMNGFVLSDGVNPDLAVDFGTPTNQVAGGYQAYTASHEIAATFTAQAFSALGATVTVLPKWGPEAAGEGPYYATVTKTSSDPLNPAANFDTNYVANYTIVLTATDTDGTLGVQSDFDTLTVRVAEDACAAKQLETAGYNTVDFDENCIVNLDDFAVLAANWLEDINLTGAVAY